MEGRGDGFFASSMLRNGQRSARSPSKGPCPSTANTMVLHPECASASNAALSHRVEDGYQGVGVHVAARIVALAEGNQILASTSSLLGLPGLEGSGPP